MDDDYLALGTIFIMNGCIGICGFAYSQSSVKSGAVYYTGTTFELSCENEDTKTYGVIKTTSIIESMYRMRIF